MQNFTRPILLSMLAFVLSVSIRLDAQSILSPTDSVITYNASAAKGSLNNPNLPAVNTIGKWIRTVRMSWNTNLWKCYVYNGANGVGIPFRLLYPKSYNPTANDGKVYPMIVFYHGAGEAGPVTDNELSLLHGGNVFTAKDTTGAFDGYVLIMQSTGGWGPLHNTYTTAIIDYMVAHNKLSPFEVLFNGLSAGGNNDWNFIETYPQYAAGALPQSGVSVADQGYINTYKYTPIWLFQGGEDGSPDPNTAAQLVSVENTAGGNLKYTLYPTLGHDTWDQSWAEPDFFPFCLRQYSSNPWTLFGRTQFCPGVAVNVTMGVAPGYDAYQWRQNGVLIPGATTNSLNVTTYGTYDARVERNGNWSDWSHTPVVISVMPPTVTPLITVSGLMSKVIPALDNKGVNIKLPSGYASYQWEMSGNSTVLGTDSVLYVTQPGNYVAQVTQQFGCSSAFGTPFTVINANGPNKPDPASNVVASAISQTMAVLNWSQNPTPTYNETNFEIYQGTKSGGPYKLVDIVGQDIAKDTIRGLASGTGYYFVVRAVNNTGASATSNEATASTAADTQPPTAPAALTVTETGRTSVSLSWGASTDNVGVTGYYVYVNGAKTYSVPVGQTSFIVNALTSGQTYAFTVQAVDAAGNASPNSNQVSALAALNGLYYSYFTNPAGLTDLPNYAAMTPTSTGVMPNVSLTGFSGNNFGMLWQGYIIIPTTGAYSFRTTSDDGSKLYLGTLNGSGTPYNWSGTALVNNDGGHSSTTVASPKVTLTAGVYPIAIAYMNLTGGTAMAVTWSTPSQSAYYAIPNSSFTDGLSISGSAPAAPSYLAATVISYKSVSLTWTDNSNNETGFEVWRSTSFATGYTILGTTKAGAVSFIDSTCTASTHYYYEVRAINQSGQSAFTSTMTQAEWPFNNNYSDTSGNGHVLTPVNAPVFDNANKAEGNYSLKLNGTNQDVTIGTTGGFLQEVYNQRTIAFWLKASATTGTNKVIFDIGGSDNGLALLLSNNTLIAAVASGNTRSNITVSYTSTGWNHIALVYNGDSLLLYVNGVVAASKVNLTFHTLNTTTNGSAIGLTNGSNAYNTNGTYFGGWIDDFGVYSSALGADAVNALMGLTFHQSNAITSATPPVPAAPSGLTGVAKSASSTGLSWTNNGTNANSIQVYRSSNNNQNYYLLATLPAATTSYTDQGLYPEAVYYYKLNAVNAGGASAYSNEVNVTTKDTLPVVAAIGNLSVRYGVVTTVPVSATWSLSGTLALSAPTLPSFVVFKDSGDRAGSMVFSPNAGNAGNYTGLYVVATDAFGGTDTVRFTVNVNNNYAPVMDTIVNYTMRENDTLNIPLVATEQNGADVLSFAVSNLPNAYSIVNASNGVATLKLHPNYSAAGTYAVKVTTNDQNGLSAMRTFTLTVINKDPNEYVYVRFPAGDALTGIWNNVTGVTSANFFDTTGVSTGIGLQLQTNNWFITYNGGPTTGNNSGVYPDAVLKDYFYFAYFGAPDTVPAVLTGLDTSKSYNLTFFASSIWSGTPNNGSTIYTSGNQNVSLPVQDNLTNTASLNGLKPNADGTLDFSMRRAANATVGYLNAFVITKVYDDGTAPASAQNLQLQNVSNASGNGVQVSWTDQAYNASGYQVYRSGSSGGTYNLVGSVGPQVTSFLDTTVSGALEYYYQVTAYNPHGSTATGVDSILTTDRVPRMGAISDVTLSSGQSDTVKVVSTDDPTDHVTLTASGLPAFASFVDNGNGTGTIVLSPGSGANGVYSGLTVTGTDRSDSSRSVSFNVYVVEQNVSATYVNFTDTTLAPRPWNNMSGIPFPGTVLNGLTDDSNTPTGISVTLQDGFQGNTEIGNNPNNGTTVYPASVLKSGFFTAATSSSRLLIQGLSQSKVYNFQLFNSYSTGNNCATVFTQGGNTQTLNASYNSNKTVEFNGVSPDANGTVTITVTKASGADYAMINSMVIEAYEPSVVPLMSPADLRVIASTESANTLQWQDRAANETGYEVWRSTDGSGTFSLLATVAANTTGYVDQGLPKDATYYYVVRAVNSGTYSAYSNMVKGYTYASQLYVAFDDGALSPAPPSPWNNLNLTPQVGNVWSNFSNDAGVVTNMGMLETGLWAGEYGGGVNTGNNSGIYPDNVMVESYGLFAGGTASVTLTGLDLSKTYDFTFFGSATGVFDATASYTVNNSQPVYLNANLNKSGTVTLYGVTANPDGTALITVSADQATSSQFGLLSAMVVHGATPSANTAPTPPVTPAVTGAMSTTTTTSNRFQNDSSDNVLKDLAAYPNPYTQGFTLTVPSKSGAAVTVEVLDASGRVVYAKRFEGLFIGTNALQITPPSSTAPGLYLVRVIDVQDNAQQTLKLMKR